MSRLGLVNAQAGSVLASIFVRLEAGLPSVQEMAAPYLDELAAHQIEELRAADA